MRRHPAFGWAAGLAFWAAWNGGIPPARAELWTNAAGHAIEAQWVGGDSQTVILERPNGQRISLPLLSLSPGARQAAEKRREDATPAEEKKAPAGPTGPVADHARALYAAGQISAEELQATLNSIPPAAQ